MSYLLFLRGHWRLLGFGAAVMFFSSFGQTFFVSLFNASLGTALGLGSGDLGAMYSTATLASAGTLIWLGRKIDDWDLRLYTVLACGLMTIGAGLMAGAGTAIWVAVAFYFLRIGGQGLMSHIALTSMGRYFAETRGRAIAIASFGFPVAEAILPITAVALIAWLGWRQSWALIAAIIVVLVVPLLLWLLRGHATRHRHFIATTAPATGATAPRVNVLRDARFYLCLPTFMASPFIITGLFFHQAVLAQAKGWSLAWLASCFVAFAIVQALSSLQSGAIVDRVGARRLLPFYLLPMAAALSVLTLSDHPGVALAYLVGLRITSGLDGTVGTSVWAELYGVQRLGAIRALATSLMVFSSALSPFLMGWMLDHGVTVHQIAWACAAYCLVSLFLSLPVAMRRSA